MFSSTPSRQAYRSETGIHTLLQYLLLAALSLAALSYWLPWIDHDAAALRLAGQDMGEFVKFLPASQQTAEGWSANRVPRQLFYLPPFVCSICLAILVPNRQAVYPRWLRTAMFLGATWLLLGLLPPVWGHPRELLTGEFRLQGYGLILGLSLALGHGLYRNIPLWPLVMVIGALSALALIAAQGAFWLVRPHIWAAYNTPTLSLGWGLWIHIAAWVATVGLGVYIYVRS
jgi:hypothetical protein